MNREARLPYVREGITERDGNTGGPTRVGALTCLEIPFWIKSYRFNTEANWGTALSIAPGQENEVTKQSLPKDREEEMGRALWEWPLRNTGSLACSPWESLGCGLLMLS